MSTHNMCFCGEIRKISLRLGCKKVPNLELCEQIKKALIELCKADLDLCCLYIYIY